MTRLQRDLLGFWNKFHIISRPKRGRIEGGWDLDAIPPALLLAAGCV